MPRVITGPDGTTHQFPTEAPIADIKDALSNQYGDAAPNIGNLQLDTGASIDQILDAITSVESGGNRYAKNKGSTAYGLGQILNGTASNPGYGIAPLKDRTNPVAVRRFQRDYLSAALDNGGSPEDAIIAYNQGIGAMKKWIAAGRPTDSPFYTAGQKYLDKVLSRLPTDNDTADSNQDTTGGIVQSAEAPPAAANAPSQPADYDNDTFLGSVKNGFRQTLLNSDPEALGNALEAFGHITGIQRLQDWGKSIEGLAQPDTADPNQISSMRQMRHGHMVDDATNLLGYYLGSGAGALLPGLAPALAGGAIAGPPGFVGGMFMGSTFLNTGNIYKQLTDEKVDPRASSEWAVPLGLMGGVLDTVTMKSIIGSAASAPEHEGFGALAKWIAARVADGASKQAITQGVKQMIFNAGDASATGTNILDPDKLWNVADSVVGGMVQGGAMEGVMGGTHYALKGGAPSNPKPTIETSPLTGRSVSYKNDDGTIANDTVTGVANIGDTPHFVMQSGKVVPASQVGMNDASPTGIMPGPTGFVMGDNGQPTPPEPPPGAGYTGEPNFPVPAARPQPGLPAVPTNLGNLLDPRLRTPGPNSGILLPSPPPYMTMAARPVPKLPAPTVLSPDVNGRTTGPNSGVLVPPPAQPGIGARLGVEPVAAQPGAAIMPMPGNENNPGIPVTPPLLPPPVKPPEAPQVPVVNRGGNGPMDYDQFSKAVPNKGASISATGGKIDSIDPRPVEAAAEADAAHRQDYDLYKQTYNGIMNPEAGTVGASLSNGDLLTHLPEWAKDTGNTPGQKLAYEQALSDLQPQPEPAKVTPGEVPMGDPRASLSPSLKDENDFASWAQSRRMKPSAQGVAQGFSRYQEAFHYASKGLADRDIDAQLASLKGLIKSTKDPIQKLAYNDAYQQLAKADDPANSIGMDPRSRRRMQSSLENAIESMPVSQMEGREWYKYLADHPGISRAELRIMGLEDMLGDNPNTVNKETMKGIAANAKTAMDREIPMTAHPEERQGKRVLVVDHGLPYDEYGVRRLLNHAARSGYDAISWKPTSNTLDNISGRLMQSITSKWSSKPYSRDAMGDNVFHLPPKMLDQQPSASLSRRLTTEAREQYETIAKNLMRLAKEVAPTVDLRFEQLGGRNDTAGEQFANMVFVSLERSHDPYSTFFHEIVHAFERMGFFTPDEMRILAAGGKRLQEMAFKMFPRHVEVLKREMANKPWEERAYGMEAYLEAKLQGRDDVTKLLPDGPLQRVLNKFATFFERVGNWLKGNGFSSMSDVFDRVLSGEVGHRNIQYTYDTPSVRMVNALAASETGTTSKGFIDKFGQTKIRDEYGRPGLLYVDYSGDPAKPAGHSSGALDYAFMGPGYYLSRDPQAGDKFSRGTQITSFVSMKDPLDAARALTAAHKVQLSKSMGLLQGLPPKALATMDHMIRNSTTVQDLLDSGHPILMALVNRMARAMGHDGVIFTHDGDEHVLAFHGGQLSSPMELASPKAAMTSLSQTTASLLTKKDGPYNFAEPHDIGLLGHYVYTKRMLAIKDPHFTPVYQNAEGMFRYRSGTIQEASKLASPYGRLEQTDKRAIKDVNAALELARLQGLKLEPNKDGHIIVANQLRHTDLSRIGDVIHLDTPQKVQAYQAAVAAGRSVLTRMKEAMIGIDGEESGKPIFKTIGGIKIRPDATYQQLSDLAGQAKAMMENPELKDNAEARAHLDTVSKQFQNLANNVGHFEALLKTDYVPFARFGDYGVILEDKDTGEIRHFEMFEGTKTSFGRRANMGKINTRISELLARYPNSRVRRPEGGGPAIFRITHDNIKSLVGQGLASFDMIAGLLGSADKQTYAQIRDVLAEAIRQRNFRAHLTPTEMVPGYSTDFGRAIANYVVGGSGYAARQMYGPLIEEAISSIPKNKTGLIKVAHDYEEYIMNPVEEHSFLKSLGFAWFLGGNVSSALVQLSNLPMLSAPHLSQFTSFGKANLELVRGFKDASKMFGKTSGIWAKHFMSKYAGTGQAERPVEPYIGLDINTPAVIGHLSPEEQKAVVRAWNDGTLKPLLNIQQVGLVPGMRTNMPRGVTKVWQNAQSILSSMFGTAESTGRVAQFLAAYRLARKDPDVLLRADNVYQKDALYQREVSGIEDPMEKAYKFAQYGIDDVMGNVSKVNRAPYQSGEGQLVFQFQSWVHLILETLARQLTMHGAAGKKAFALAAAWTMAMGGAFGLPGADDLKLVVEGVWRQVTKQLGHEEDLDLKRELRQATLGWTDNKHISDFMVRGMDGMLGVALGGRVALGRTPMNDILSGLFGDGEVDDFGGPVGAILHGNFTAYSERRAHNEPVWSASREFMPLFIRNAMEGAFIWNKQGYRTRSREIMVPPENITGGERILRGIGFMPSKEANAAEVLSESRGAAEKYKGAKEQLNAQYENAVVDQMDAFYSHDNASLKDARQKVKDAQKAIVDWNASHPESAAVMPASNTQTRAITKESFMQLNPLYRFPRQVGKFGAKEVLGVEHNFPDSYLKPMRSKVLDNE